MGVGDLQGFDDDARVRALHAQQVLDTPREERFDRVTRLAAEVFNVPMASVTLVDRDRQWRKSFVGLDGPEAPREGAFCDVTVRRGELVEVSDAAADPLFEDNPFVVGDPHLRFYAGHPVFAPGGEAIGTLCILDVEPRELTGNERALLRDLAGWVQGELVAGGELDRAATVQRALLPRTAPELPGYEMAAVCIPSGALGGDFYDWWRTPAGIRLAVADVMGKGIGAAIIAAGVRASLRTAPSRSLAEVMTDTTELLDGDLSDAATFVTGFLADLDRHTGTVQYVDAGHNLAGIVRADGSWEHLRSAGLPLGMALDDDRAVGTARLESGDALLCCSDGLIDMLGADDALDIVLSVARTSTPEECMAEVRRRADVLGMPDDVTAVMVRRE